MTTDVETEAVAPRARRAWAWVWVLVAPVVVAAASAYALRAGALGTWRPWVSLVPVYLGLALVAGFSLRAHGVLRERLRLGAGDPSLGIVSGLVLLLCAWLVANRLLPEEGGAQAWTFRVFALLDDSSRALPWLVVVMVLLEELVWRGGVQEELVARLGAWRGCVCQAGLYAAAHLPTVFTLRDPDVGYNPLLVLAALGLGLVCGLLVLRRRTLVVAVFCHGVFSYFAATSFQYFL